MRYNTEKYHPQQQRVLNNDDCDICDMYCGPVDCTNPMMESHHMQLCLAYEEINSLWHGVTPVARSTQPSTCMGW